MTSLKLKNKVKVFTKTSHSLPNNVAVAYTAANALLLIEVRKSLTQFPFSFPKSTETSRIASLVIGNSKCIILTNYNTWKVMAFKIIRLAQTRFQITQINRTTTMTQESYWNSRIRRDLHWPKRLFQWSNVLFYGHWHAQLCQSIEISEIALIQPE